MCTGTLNSLHMAAASSCLESDSGVYLSIYLANEETWVYIYNYIIRKYIYSLNLWTRWQEWTGYISYVTNVSDLILFTIVTKWDGIDHYKHTADFL